MRYSQARFYFLQVFCEYEGFGFGFSYEVGVRGGAFRFGGLGGSLLCEWLLFGVASCLSIWLNAFRRSSGCEASALLCPRPFIVFFVVVCYCFVLFNIIMREDSHFQWKCNR